MNEATASTLIEVPRSCGSRLNPAGSLLAIPGGARRRMRWLVGLVAFMLGALAVAAAGNPPSLLATPSAVTIAPGGEGTSTITVSGFSGSPTLSASGLPNGVTASFNPNPASGTSTLTLTASATAAAGTVSVTVTGIFSASFLPVPQEAETTITLTVNSQLVGCAPNTANYPCVYVANSSDGTVSVINAITNTVIPTDVVAVGSFPAGLAVTPNNAYVYVANSGGDTVSVISTATNTVVATVQMQNSPFQIAITPDGAYAYVTEFVSDGPVHKRRARTHGPQEGIPNLIEIISTATNEVVGSIANLTAPSAVAISPNGEIAYVADQCAPNETPCVEVVSTSTYQIGPTVLITGAAPFSEGSIAVTPDGSLVCVGIGVVNGEVTDLAVAFIATNNNSLQATLNTQTVSGISGYGFAITPGGFLYAAAFNPDGVYLINPFSSPPALVETILAGTTPVGDALAPDGASVYVTNSGDNTVSVINTKTNMVTSTINVGNNPQGVAAMQVLPIPLINQPLVPDAAPAGGAGFTLTVNGSGFATTAVVNWNGTPLATTFVSHDQVTAAVPASNIAAATTASVTVTNPAPGGGTSNVAFFTVTSPTTSLTFAASTIPVGTDPSNIVVADFNNDGKPDLAVINQNQTDSTCYPEGGAGTISILLGNGDGTFTNVSPLCFPGAPLAAGMQLLAGDFTGNGKIDLIASVQQPGSAGFAFGIFLGNGDGTFSSFSEVDGPFNAIGTIVAGDFNGDGKLDLALPVVSDGQQLFVYLGNGDGTFTFAPSLSLSSIGTSMTTGDFNKDGILDLAVISTGQQPVTILLGNGDGTFTAAATQPSVANLVSPQSVTAGDFNGDGILDLAIADAGSSNSVVLLGVGDGTFNQVTTGAPILSQDSFFVTAADFNGDNKLDLAFANSCGSECTANTITLFLGNGDGTFPAGLVQTVGNGPLAIGVADFNGDGRLDVAVANSVDNTVSILLQAPTATLSSTALTFGPLLVGTTSASQSVSITNNGSATLVISSISVTGANSGDFTATPCALPAQFAPGESCTVEITFTPTATGTRNASLSITDNAAGSPQTVSLSGVGQSFTLSASPNPVTIAQGSQGTSTITITPLSGFSGSVTLTASGLPNGVTATFNPNPATSSSTLTLTAGVTAATGTVTVTVTGTCASLTQTTTISLTVNAAPSFALSAAPSTVTITQGSQGTSTITITPMNGFSGNVTLSASGLPSGVTAAFSPNPATSSSTLTLTASATAATGMATVTVTGDSGSLMQTTTISLTVPAPAAMLNPTPVIFGSSSQPQTVGTSATNPVTLTNSGTAQLNITSIALAGQDASEFSQTNNCGASLAPAASCTINVTFTPTANGGSGSASASLSISDNAANSPQMVPITGTVENFALTTTCTSLSVVPGQTAIYTVDLAPVNGFNQSVALSCSGAPTLATCTVSPSSMTLDGSSTIQAQVTATTTQATSFLQPSSGRSNGNRMAELVGLTGLAGLAALVLLPGKRRGKPSRRLSGFLFLLLIIATLATLPSCGARSDPPGTAAGTYPLTVTATFQAAGGSAATENVSFSLVVQ